MAALAPVGKRPFMNISAEPNPLSKIAQRQLHEIQELFQAAMENIESEEKRYPLIFDIETRINALKENVPLDRQIDLIPQLLSQCNDLLFASTHAKEGFRFKKIKAGCNESARLISPGFGGIRESQGTKAILKISPKKNPRALLPPAEQQTLREVLAAKTALYLNDVLASTIRDYRVAGKEIPEHLTAFPLPPTSAGMLNLQLKKGKKSPKEEAYSLQKWEDGACSYAAHSLSHPADSGIDPNHLYQLMILDICILNLDRHLENLLVVDDKNLVFIDHGLAFPAIEHADQLRWSWRNFDIFKGPVPEFWLDVMIKINRHTLESALQEHLSPLLEKTYDDKRLQKKNTAVFREVFVVMRSAIKAMQAWAETAKQSDAVITADHLFNYFIGDKKSYWVVKQEDMILEVIEMKEDPAENQVIYEMLSVKYHANDNVEIATEIEWVTGSDFQSAVFSSWSKHKRSPKKFKITYSSMDELQRAMLKKRRAEELSVEDGRGRKKTAKRKKKLTLHFTSSSSSAVDSMTPGLDSPMKVAAAAAFIPDDAVKK